ncbi:MAG: hypothetical protein ACRDSL_16135 [Pseudonocardiaceae bacterium]
MANPIELRRSLRRLWRRPEPPPIQVESGTDAAADADATSTQDSGRPADQLSKRHFCQDCMPVDRLYDAEVVAASITLGLGVITAFWSLVIGGVLTAIGGLRIVCRLLVARRQRSADRDQPPDLHLDPRVRKLTVVETLSATAHLDAPYDYRAKITDVRGRIRVEAVWGRAHWDRWSAHRRRYRIPDDGELSLSAGSLVVRGSADLVLRPVDAESVKNLTTIVLRPSTAEHAVLRPPGAHGDPRRTFEVDYEITEPEDGWTVPVWLTPTIVPESDRRALDLEVQWRSCGPGDNGLEIKDLELLQISVPTGWGEIDHITRPDKATVSPPVDGHRRIEWKKPPVERTSRGRCRLSIRFEDQIDTAAHVTGRLRARFSGAVSGADNVDLYSAGGMRRRDWARTKPTTLVELDFELSLAAVRYQDIRSVPDRARREDDNKPEEESFEGVVPDHHTVAQLTNNLSNEGYYVKRVVENPPQPGTKANVLNRFWDIAGRLYDGVYPIDFHLVLTGEEVHDGPSLTGATTARLTVRGTYATTEMEEKVVREWSQLWTRVKSSLDSAAPGPYGASRLGDVGINASSAELSRLRNVAVSLRGRLEAGVDAGDISAGLAADLITRIEDEFSLDGLTAQE